MEEGHLPVMPDEVLGTLAPAPGSLQIDATVGGGGHTERILEAANPDGRVLGLDADQAAIDRVAPAPRAVRRPARPAPGELPRARRRSRRPRASAPSTGRCSTSGCRRFQLADRERGFGFRTGGPLDMRFDTTRGVPASELLATLDADELAALFRALRRGAVRVEDRQGDRRRPGQTAPIETAEDLAALIERVVARQPAPAPPHPPGHPRLPGAADRGQRGARRASRTGSPPRSTCCGRAAASSSCPTTRSRTASSSASSPPSGGAASARPRCPVCVCGHAPRLRLVTRPSMTPTARRDRRQPPRPQRATACRRAARRLSEQRATTSRPDPAPPHRRPGRSTPGTMPAPRYGGGVP